MKNTGKFSNRTKVFAGATFLMGIAAVVSGIKDHKDLKAIEMDAADISAAIAEIRDTVEEVVNNPETISSF